MRIKRKTVGRRIFLLSFQSVDKVVAGNGMFPALFFNTFPFFGIVEKFSEHTGIPVRTLEDWEAARRTPPEYIPRLISYQLKYEELLKEKGEE